MMSNKIAEAAAAGSLISASRFVPRVGGSPDLGR
jgi:hypothetical protein